MSGLKNKYIKTQKLNRNRKKKRPTRCYLKRFLDFVTVTPNIIVSCHCDMIFAIFAFSIFRMELCLEFCLSLSFSLSFQQVKANGRPPTAGVHAEVFFLQKDSISSLLLPSAWS